jgi:hypothetical protein
MRTITGSIRARRLRRGLTITEVAVAAAAVAALGAATIPVFRKVGCSAMRAQSAAQLSTIAAAHAAYAADHADRQFTLCPDDLGLWQGNWGPYQAANGCVDPVVLGTTGDGNTVTVGPGCGSDTSGGAFLVPATLSPGGNALQFGSYRLTNAQPMNQYVGGRFFDQTFYAPDDLGVSRKLQRHIDDGRDFEFVDDYETSYDYSIAAMFDPAVMGGGSPNNPVFQDPRFAANGYGFRSPTNAQCVHPSLKTRFLERHAMDNSPGQNRSYSGPQPYHWNEVYRGRSLALFFDGSVRNFSPSEAMKSEARLGGSKLWLRTTPLGSGGFAGNNAADFLVDTSVHYLTAGGILGRDTIAAD